MLFPADAIERARALVKTFGIGGVGGYTDSRGNPSIRNEVADFIERRDGFRPDPEVCRTQHVACSLCVFNTEPARSLPLCWGVVAASGGTRLQPVLAYIVT